MGVSDPRDLRPMLASPATDLPVDDGEPDRPRWADEMQWDGIRAIVAVRDGRVTVTSRAGNDATDRFPELAGLGEALAGTDVVLDGELVALDDAGVPSFERLQPRMQARSAATAATAAPRVPPRNDSASRGSRRSGSTASTCPAAAAMPGAR